MDATPPQGTERFGPTRQSGIVHVALVLLILLSRLDMRLRRSPGKYRSDSLCGRNAAPGRPGTMLRAFMRSIGDISHEIGAGQPNRYKSLPPLYLMAYLVPRMGEVPLFPPPPMHARNVSDTKWTTRLGEGLSPPDGEFLRRRREPGHGQRSPSPSPETRDGKPTSSPYCVDKGSPSHFDQQSVTQPRGGRRDHTPQKTNPDQRFTVSPSPLWNRGWNSQRNWN